MLEHWKWRNCYISWIAEWQKNLNDFCWFNNFVKWVPHLFHSLQLQQLSFQSLLCILGCLASLLCGHKFSAIPSAHLLLKTSEQSRESKSKDRLHIQAGDIKHVRVSWYYFYSQLLRTRIVGKMFQINIPPTGSILVGFVPSPIKGLTDS